MKKVIKIGFNKLNSQEARELNNSQSETKKLNGEIMLKRALRGRPPYIYKEVRMTFQMRLWDEHKLNMYEDLTKKFEADKYLRHSINRIIRHAYGDAVRFCNDITKKQYKEGIRKSLNSYDDEKLERIQSKNNNSQKIEDVILDYGFEGQLKEVATMIMEGYNDYQIQVKMNISKHRFNILRNKMLAIITRSNK